MKRRITLNLRDDLLQRVMEIAEQSNRDPEQLLEEWVSRYADDLPVETLSDDEVLRLCDFEMNIIQKQELRNLLYLQNEDLFTNAQQIRLDELLQSYRRGIIRQARAIEVATSRGLIHTDS